jgi:hypothetical protein
MKELLAPLALTDFNLSFFASHFKVCLELTLKVAVVLEGNLFGLAAALLGQGYEPITVLATNAIL